MNKKKEISKVYSYSTKGVKLNRKRKKLFKRGIDSFIQYLKSNGNGVYEHLESLYLNHALFYPKDKAHRRLDWAIKETLKQ